MFSNYYVVCLLCYLSGIALSSYALTCALLTSALSLSPRSGEDDLAKQQQSISQTMPRQGFLVPWRATFRHAISYMYHVIPLFVTPYTILNTLISLPYIFSLRIFSLRILNTLLIFVTHHVIPLFVALSPI